MLVFLLAPQRTGTSIFLKSISKIQGVDIHNEPIGLRHFASVVYRKLLHQDLLIELIKRCNTSKKKGVAFTFLKEPTLCFLPIHKWFPDAKFIHLKRDKKDWIKSCIERKVKREENILTIKPYADLDKYKRMSEKEKLEEEYDKTHEIPDKIDCLHLTYEEMCQKPKQTAKKVCDYLGIPFQDLFTEVHTKRINL